MDAASAASVRARDSAASSAAGTNSFESVELSVESEDSDSESPWSFAAAGDCSMPVNAASPAAGGLAAATASASTPGAGSAWRSAVAPRVREATGEGAGACSPELVGLEEVLWLDIEDVGTLFAIK